MKLLAISFVLIAVTSTLRCAAQVNQAPNSSSPRTMQSSAQRPFLKRFSGHRLQTPQQKAAGEAMMAQLDELRIKGAQALQEGDFAAAEVAFRGLIEADPFSPYAHYWLGDALVGQGKNADAIIAYRVGIYRPTNAGKNLNDIPLTEPSRGRLSGCQNQTVAVSWMKCVLLLSQTGQSKEAAAIYKEALTQVPDANTSGMSLSLDSNTPAPETLQAAAHIALGLCATFSGADHDRAMSEFDAARRLRPDLPLTNYYYGYGWQHLDPKSATRQANAAQAKAAFQQAATYGVGEVKKSAEEALTRFK